MERLNCSLNKNRKLKQCKIRPKPLIPYFGGKQRVADDIISRFPKHHLFVENFVGGGGAIYWKNTIPERFVINDLNKDVYKVYKTSKNSPNQIKNCNFKINSKKEFMRIRDKRNKSACDIIRIHKNGFSGSPRWFAFKDRPMKNDFNENQINKLKKTRVLNKDFKKVAKEFDKKGVVQYWDPPYSNAGSEYKTHGVTPEEVCDFAKKIKKAKIFISYDNSKKVRRACSNLKKHSIKVPYTSSGKFRNVKELLYEN